MDGILVSFDRSHHSKKALNYMGFEQPQDQQRCLAALLSIALVSESAPEVTG